MSGMDHNLSEIFESNLSYTKSN